MSLLGQLKNILGQHSNTGANPAEPADSILEKTAKSSPQNLVEGVMEAFRSNQTPPFSQLASQLFTNANPEQKSGLLNTLLGALGPSALGQLGAKQGGLSSILSSLQGGNVPPAQADHVSPQEFGQLAEEAAKQNPSVIDQVSQFVSQNPALIKTLGGSALAVVMSKLTGKGS